MTWGIKMKILDEFIEEIKKFGVSNAATLSGVSQPALWKWIEGKTIPTLVNAQKVANAMGLEFLLFDME